MKGLTIECNTPKIDLRLVRFAFRVVRERVWNPNRRVRLFIHTTELCDYYGCAYVGGGRCTVRINPNHRGVKLRRYARFDNMPEFITYGLEESIVFICAHEFGHSFGIGGGKENEIRCELLAAKAVRLWRDRQYESPACLI